MDEVDRFLNDLTKERYFDINNLKNLPIPALVYFLAYHFHWRIDYILSLTVEDLKILADGYNYWAGKQKGD